MRSIFLVFLLLSLNGLGQTYILNEDFGNSSGTTPPPNWTNYFVTGSASDLWSFDNAGNQNVNYPIIAPFAIFDSKNLSSNGQPEEVVLESPSFDASISNYTLLEFNHTFQSGNYAKGELFVYNGEDWTKVTEFTTSTLNPEQELIDISAHAGGITNAKIRFVWKGDGDGFWAIDNISILAPLALDGGMVNLENPVPPFGTGAHEIIVSLGNYGYQELTTSTIRWSVDGIIQNDYSWNGQLSFGEIETNINIGSYIFNNEVVTLKVWQEFPNGAQDQNPLNDTIIQKMVPTMCGDYTIGGTNPDFTTFNEAVDALIIAGISCPVRFLVRDGTHPLNVSIPAIDGSSSTNTISFIGENADSSLVSLEPENPDYNYLFHLDASSHIRFKHLGFNFSDDYQFLLSGTSSDIQIDNCLFRYYGTIYLQNTFSENISIRNNRFIIGGRIFKNFNTNAVLSNILIEKNLFLGGNESKIDLERYVSNAIIRDNELENGLIRIITKVDDDGQSLIYNNVLHTGNTRLIAQGNGIKELTANHISNSTALVGLSAFNINNCLIANNFIHTIGFTSSIGLEVKNAVGSRIAFNTINNTNEDFSSVSLFVEDVEEITVLNNILSNPSVSFPVFIGSNSSISDWDYNNYYSKNGPVGMINGEIITNFEHWKDLLNGDENSININPHFIIASEPDIHNALLNNVGLHITDILVDIDGINRNNPPDIGAKEFDLCHPDAGIEAFTAPVMPLDPGINEIRVLLQNHGSSNLTSVDINWTVNGETQETFSWSGNLGYQASEEVHIGDFDFQNQLYEFVAWTENPNGEMDCKPCNDTAKTVLATSLCGDYTIGGIDPDFQDFNQAWDALIMAGISCSVRFYVRDGEYYENKNIPFINGSDITKTISFIGESGDSTAIQIHPSNSFYNYIFKLNHTSFITFHGLGFNGSEAYPIEIGGENEYINFENNYLHTHSTINLLEANSSNLTFINNRFANGGNIGTTNSDNDTLINILVRHNIFNNSDYTSKLAFLGNCINIGIDSNYIANGEISLESQKIDSEGFSTISHNTIDKSNYTGIRAEGKGINRVWNNRINNILNGSGIKLTDLFSASIVNNFVYGEGLDISIGLEALQVQNTDILYNTVNLANSNSSSVGIKLSSCSDNTIINNIFACTGGGLPVSINHDADLHNWDHNDYFSSNGFIAFYDSEIIDDLNVWRANTQADASSYDVDPYFGEGPNETPNHIDLDGTAIPNADVLVDIDGLTRHTEHPDIGAKEFEVCDPDIALQKLVSPGKPIEPGLRDIIVTIRNNGYQSISEVDIHLKINDNVFPVYNYSGNIQSNQKVDVTLGQYEFNSNENYLILIYTDSPNGQTDCDAYNDTIRLQTTAAMCGDYTIGGDSPDFLDFEEAVFTLKAGGINCPVRFFVRDGTYQHNLSIPHIIGSSEHNTIQFIGESGDSSNIIINSKSISTPFVFQLDGCSNISFVGIGFGNTNSSTYRLSSTVDNIYIKNNHFVNMGGVNILEAHADNIIISENHFARGGVIRKNFSSGAIVNNLTVSNNVFEGQHMQSSIFIYNEVSNVRIDSNTFSKGRIVLYDNSENGTSNSFICANDLYAGNNVGINVLGNGIRLINANKIIGVENNNALMVNDIDSCIISNNFVQCQGISASKAINISFSNRFKLVYNSVNNLNNNPSTYGLALENCEEFTVKNNIICNKIDGYPIYGAGTLSPVDWDYNDYYSPDDNIAFYHGSTYDDLSIWGAFINGDANSQTLNPFYRSDSDLRPRQREINGAGIQIPEIVLDIDGELRNNVAPDIGADEFMVDFGITELLSPTLNCFHESYDSVTIFIHQFGDVPFIDLQLSYQMNNGPIYTETIPGSIDNDIIYTFENPVNISATGDYYFKIWLGNTYDDNLNNDTLKTWRYTKPSPIVNFTYSNECTGREVFFSGQASVISPYWIESYEWDFGDGAISVGQTTSHIFESLGSHYVNFKAYSNAGCYNDTTILINTGTYEAINIGHTISESSCSSVCEGEIELDINGGISPLKVYYGNQVLNSSVLTGLCPGEHIIRVTDNVGCERSESVILGYIHYMESFITADPPLGTAPQEIIFTADTVGAIDMLWTFEEGITDSINPATHLFETMGTYPVVLTTYSGEPYNCITHDTLAVLIEAYVNIETPNVFSPNNDGFEDVWQIHSEGLEALNCKIFNRNYQLIHEFNELDGYWDGNKKNGKEASEGNYFFFITANDLNGRDQEKTGSILLQREMNILIPNPIIDKSTLDLSKSLEGEIRIEVISCNGNKLKEWIFHDQIIELNLKDLKPGLYFIRATDSQNIIWFKFIKS